MPKVKKAEINRERLLSQGAELLSEHGFHGIGLKELLGAVNVPKGSFYNYFESKEAFGARVAEYYAEQFRDLMDSLLNEPSANGLGALQHFFDVTIQTLEQKGFKHGCLLGSLGAEVSDTSEVCRRAVSQSMQVFKAQFEHAILRGQEDGSIRRDVPAGELADIMLNSWEGALLRMKIEKSRRPLEQFQEIVLNRFFAGG